MKKFTRMSIALLLVGCVAFLSVSNVFAASDTSVEWADPTATANKTSTTFSTSVLNMAELPGIVDDDATMIVPTGFNGQKQIGGNGIEVSGLATSADTVEVCFAFPTYTEGWSGLIYKWDGSAWTAVETTVVAPTGENSLYHVCTPKAGNGTYALLVNYSD